MSSQWRPLVSGDECEDCYAPGGAAHARDCPEGEAILRECLADEATERAIDEASER